MREIQLDNNTAEAIFRDAAQLYIAGCRERIGPFIARNFGFSGTLRMHRHALGRDLVRAPANLLLAVPHAVFKMLSALSRPVLGPRVGDWLGSRKLLLTTDIDREVEWRIYSELLMLPVSGQDRSSPSDALADAILAHPDMKAALAQVPAEGKGVAPHARERLSQNMRSYAGTRAAASDIAAAMTSTGVGAFALNKLTPSALSLGPALAAHAANQSAVAEFPFGQWAGEIWYDWFPVEPSGEMVWGITFGLMVTASFVAAFSGIAADPLQRRLGIHRKRLVKLIDALEADLAGDGNRSFAVRSHYVARLLDVFEAIRAAARAAV